MRSALFTLVGALLFMAATFFYAYVFLDGAMQESAFRLVIGGTLVGGLLGLLVAAMTRPSGARWNRLILLGAVGGLLAGLVYGVVAPEDVCVPSSYCGRVFLGRLFQYPWMPMALWAVFGGVVGAFLGLVAGFGFLRRKSAVEAGVDAAWRG